MYAFIHIPKTAGSSVRAILRRSFGSRHCDLRVASSKRSEDTWLDAEDLRRARRVYPRLEGICGHRVACFGGLEQEADLRFFTWVREPVKRFVSHFLYCYRGRLEICTPDRLKVFCAEPFHRNMQSHWLGGAPRAEAAMEMLEKRIGFVGMTEAFDESLVLFRRWLNHPALDIAYTRKNPCRGEVEWPILNDPDMRACIEDANREDVALYRHIREVIFQRQTAAFGPALEAETAEFRRRNEFFREPAEPLWARIKRDLIYKPFLHLPVG
jgi:hypothetical protein